MDGEYLGDGVYVMMEGDDVVLSLDRDANRETIVLEPEVVDALIDYLRKRSRIVNTKLLNFLRSP